MPEIRQYTRQIIPTQTVSNTTDTRGERELLQFSKEARQEDIEIQQRKEKSDYLAKLAQIELENARRKEELSNTDFDPDVNLSEVYAKDAELRLGSVQVPESMQDQFNVDKARISSSFGEFGIRDRARREGIRTKLNWETTLENAKNIVSLDPNNSDLANALVNEQINSMPSMPREVLEQLKSQAKNEIASAKATTLATASPNMFMQQVNDGEWNELPKINEYISLANRNIKRLEEEHKKNSYLEFYKNPTEDGLKYLEQLKPEMTETEKNRLLDIYESSPNYEMTTTFSGYEGALADIQKLAVMPNETSKQKEAILSKSVDIVYKMKRSNLGSADRASTLSQEDIDGLSQTMYKSINDSLFKKELADMPDISVFSKIYKNAIEPFMNDRLIKTTTEGLERANRIREIGLSTSSNMVKALMNGDKETADKLYQSGLEEAIRQKYHYLPEMQGKLEPDKTTFNINGKPYVFKGFGSEDIILEKLD